MQKQAILFPGQGSQAKGMLAAFAEHAIVRDVFAEASDVLGYDVWDLCQTDPAQQLDQTQVTQPCLLTASVALWRQAIAEQRFELGNICFLAGHSLGEYSALVCAEALTLREAVQLVATRGRLMQSAVPGDQGAMSAIMGLSSEQVSQLCEQVDGEVQAANFNSAEQTVISGAREAVLAANGLAKSHGAKLVKLLAVSVPAHSALMASIVDEFSVALDNVNWQSPRLPVLSNVDVCVYADRAEILSGLRRQLTGAVRWYESVEYMRANGVEAFYECGPGQVLAKLNKRIIKGCRVQSLAEIALGLD